MKKVIAMLLSALMLGAVVGCGDDSGSAATDQSKVEGAVELFFKASCEADVDSALALYTDEMVDYLKEQYGSKSEMKKELESELEDELDEAEDEYGKFERYEYEVVDTTSYDDDEVDEIQDSFDMIDIDVKVTSVKEVEVEYTIYFEDDEIEDTTSLILFKADGKWYMLDSEGIF